MGWQMVDDLTGVPIGDDDDDGGTVTITVDADACEVDLCGEGKRALRELLQPYYDAGRPVDKPAQTSPTRSTRTPSVRSTTSPPKGEPGRAELRRWAKEQGIPVSEKGNVSADIRDRYLQAHRGEQRPRPTGSYVPLPGSGARPEQLAEAEELIAVGNATMHTIAAATGLTVEQVRELNAKIQRGAAS